MKKSITKNYLYNLTYQILIIIVPLITTPYLSRVLGAEKIGIYSYTVSVATYFILFGTLGVAMYGQREIAYVQEKKRERSKVFFEIFIMRFITLSFSLIIFYIGFCTHGEYNTYYKILVLEIVGNCLDISWFFQGLEEFKKTVTRSIMVRIISVISIFVFIKGQQDIYKYFWILVLTTLIGNISLWFYLPQYVERIKIKELKILKHLKPTIKLFIPQIAIQIYTVLDKTMLGTIISDKSQVAIYEQSQKIVKLPLTLVTALGIVVSPRIANTIANNKNQEVIEYLKKSFRFVWFSGVPVMFGVMAIAKNLVPWFLGAEFYEAISVIMIGAPLVMAIGLNDVSGVQYLVGTRKNNLFTRSVITGAIFNFILNMCLIPIFKARGAILASVLAEFLVLSVQLFYVRKDFPIKIVYQNSGKYLLSGIIMFIITFALNYFLESTIISTLIQIVIGVLTYVTLLILFKDKMLMECFSKIKNKIFNKFYKKIENK